MFSSIGAPKTFGCPFCSARLFRSDIRLDRPFRCSNCGKNLLVVQPYSELVRVISFLLAGLVAYGMGVHGLGLPVVMLLVFVPVMLSVAAVARRIAPPSLVPFDLLTNASRAAVIASTKPNDARPAEFECPQCGTHLSWREISFAPFLCPACGRGIRVPSSYCRVVSIVVMALPVLITYGVGVRGDWLLVVPWLGLFPPISTFVFAVSFRVAPPELTFSDDYLSVLHTRLPDKKDDEGDSDETNRS